MHLGCPFPGNQSLSLILYPDPVSVIKEGSIKMMKCLLKCSRQIESNESVRCSSNRFYLGIEYQSRKKFLRITTFLQFLVIFEKDQMNTYGNHFRGRES